LNVRQTTDLTPIDLVVVAVAAILIGHALQINSGFYDPAALTCIGAAAVCCVAALVRLPSRIARQPGSERLLALVLLAGVLSNLVALSSAPPAFYLREPFTPLTAPFLTGLMAAAIAALFIVFHASRALLWFSMGLLACGILGVWTIHESPRPRIDVITVYSASLYALREGQSPYGISFTNIYGHGGYYGSGLTKGSEVLFGFPYPPLALLMAIPGKAVGDIRYAELLGLLIGGAAMAWSGRNRVAALAAMLLLFSPRSLFVLEQGWSEPFVICWLGLVIFAASRSLSVAVPLGLLLAVKQHLMLAMIFAPWLVRDAWPGQLRRLAIAMGVAALVTGPFIIWDPDGFWHSVVALQFREPFRLDSLSVLAAMARVGWPLSAAVALAIPLTALSVGTLLCWRFAPRTPSGFALSLGLCLLLLFLFSKKAFCNYYYLVIALLVASVAAAPHVQNSRVPTGVMRQRTAMS
jgi:hypothetical protein